MVQIIDENRRPSFRDQLMGGLGNAAKFGATQIPQMLAGRQQERSENEAIQRLSGQNLSGLNPELKKLLLAQQLKSAGNKPDVSGATNALNKLEGMIDKRGIGKGTRFSPFTGFGLGPEARRNRGEFQSLQAAILPLFKGMFPRGMTEKEFKFIQENYVPQAFDTEETIRGKIKGLRELVEGGNMDMGSMQQPSSKRPPLSSFGR